MMPANASILPTISGLSSISAIATNRCAAQLGSEAAPMGNGNPHRHHASHACWGAAWSRPPAPRRRTTAWPSIARRSSASSGRS
jgi:hypothetical protein